MSHLIHIINIMSSSSQWTWIMGVNSGNIPRALHSSESKMKLYTVQEVGSFNVVNCALVGLCIVSRGENIDHV